MEKLQDLMKKWEEKERDYNETIDKVQLLVLFFRFCVITIGTKIKIEC